MLTCSYRSIIYIFFAWMLAACGGGGGGGVDASDGNIGGDLAELTITPDITPFTEGLPFSIDADSQLTIRATVTDASGAPVTNAQVSYSIDVGNIDTLSTITNSSGITATAAILSAGATGSATAGTLRITAISGSSVGVKTVPYISAENGEDSPVTPTPSDTTVELTFLSAFDDSTTPPTETAFLSQQSIPFGDTIFVKVVVSPAQAGTPSVAISSTTTSNGSTIPFGSLDTTSLEITTDSGGETSSGVVALRPGDQSGTASITATFGEFSDQEDISIINPSILIGFANDDNSINTSSIKINDDDSLNSVTLSSGGTALLATEIFIENTAGTFTHSGNNYSRYTQSAKIDYTSNCATTPDSQNPAINRSSISYSSSDSNTISGVTLATYKTVSCTSTDTVQASTTINNTLFTATTAINFNPQVANLIEFVDVKDSAGNSINSIALQGSPSVVPQSAQVTFRVLDDSNPVQGVKVFFSLTTSKGGVRLSTDDPDTVTYPDGIPLSTDADGEVTVIVTSGNLPTGVAISARIEDPTDPTNNPNNDVIDGEVIPVTSTALAVNTGIPHQGGFTIAADNRVPNAFDYQGVPVELTVFATDVSGIAAPNGTSINFKTENNAGQLVNENTVDSNNCLINNGSCSITWKSQQLSNKPDVSQAIDKFIDTANPISGKNINDVDILLATLSNGKTLYQAIVEFGDDIVTSNTEVIPVSPGTFTTDLTSFGITANDLLTDSTSSENSLGSTYTTLIDLSAFDASPVPVLRHQMPNDTLIANYTIADVLAAESIASLTSMNISTLPFSSYISNKNDRYGRVQVLSWTTGEETFTDDGGDGLFNGNLAAEEIDDLPEAFTDNNQDGVRDQDPGVNLEEFEDFNGNTTYDAANGIYNGFRCDDAARTAGHCPDINKLVDVRASATIIAATKSLNLAFVAPGTDLTLADYRGTNTFRPLTQKSAIYKGMLRPVTNGVKFDDNGNITEINIDETPSSSFTFTVIVYDENGNPPPSGTTIDVVAPTTAKLDSPTATLTTPSTDDPYSFTVTISRDPDAEDTSSGLSITWTTPANVSGPALSATRTITIAQNP
ncbi:Ig-like domain-containing protein [Litoribacillus peritrichatus]|uniref:Big-1 domain-containing protein n=1 Tax=Litoribacillus peritrichatus TaxID=718191 RepID=A0ABP7N949_9GAMM